MYCEDRGSHWPPQGPAMFGQEGMQQAWRSNSQFRLHSNQGPYEDRGSLWPLGVTKCQAKKEYTETATAMTNFGASTRSVNAPTGDSRERDKSKACRALPYG